MREPPVHQMVFASRGANPLNRDGFRPVASSLDLDSLARIAPYLQPYARVSGFDRPQNSLCYLADQQRAVVLYRTRIGFDNRTDVCHALIGGPKALGVPVVLGLAESYPWLTSWDAKGDDHMLPLAAQQLRDIAEEGRDVLARRLVDNAGETAPRTAMLVQKALRDPHERILVDLDGTKPLLSDLILLVWGITEITGVLRGDLWDFSTYESGDDAMRGRAPAVAFVPPQPATSFGHHVRRIRPWNGGSSPDLERVALFHAMHGTDQLRAVVDSTSGDRSDAWTLLSEVARKLGQVPVPVPAASTRNRRLVLAAAIGGEPDRLRLATMIDDICRDPGPEADRVGMRHVFEQHAFHHIHLTKVLGPERGWDQIGRLIVASRIDDLADVATSVMEMVPAPREPIAVEPLPAPPAGSQRSRPSPSATFRWVSGFLNRAVGRSPALWWFALTGWVLTVLLALALVNVLAW